MTTQIETLGPAERIIQLALNSAEHTFHGRPGIVIKDTSSITGVKWLPVTHKVEGNKKVVYHITKVGNKQTKTKLGVLKENNQVKNGRTLVGEYRKPGIHAEAAVYLYNQVAEVWKLDNEFAARWASYAYGQEHRDLKVVLAAFMLVQSRKGDPVIDDGKVAFHDEDFRDVGEAMMLTLKKDVDLNPKLLLRIHDLLRVPGVAEVNRKLGFGKSARHAFTGRWSKVVEKWLRYREENRKLLEGLIKAGFRTTVMDLARRVGYKPTSAKFFETLRWKQGQAEDGRRTIAIGQAVAEAESWAGLNEATVCARIVETKPSFKRIVGLLPKEVGLTRAVVAASIEAGAMSDKDLIIYTPTLEDLGLLQVPDVKARWEKAVKNAEDMRAANILTRVKSKVVKEKLQEAADNSLKKATEEVTKNLRIYLMVDISGSMEAAIEQAKIYLSSFVQGLPLDRLHVAVFNTSGRVVEIKHASKAGVENAFRGITAGGGTDHGAGVRALQGFKTKQDEDAIFIFVGDEEQSGEFSHVVRASGLNPLAFGLLKIVPTTGSAGWRAAQNYSSDCVRRTAAALGVPCFQIDTQTFSDVYAIPRTIRALVASTPVSQTVARTTKPRLSLVETILKTDLLKKPTWSIAA
jgi:hypothetical protein